MLKSITSCSPIMYPEGLHRNHESIVGVTTSVGRPNLTTSRLLRRTTSLDFRASPTPTHVRAVLEERCLAAMFTVSRTVWACFSLFLPQTTEQVSEPPSSGYRAWASPSWR
jgi:hypothetical protein